MAEAVRAWRLPGPIHWHACSHTVHEHEHVHVHVHVLHVHTLSRGEERTPARHSIGLLSDSQWHPLSDDVTPQSHNTYSRYRTYLLLSETTVNPTELYSTGSDLMLVAL